MNKATLQQLFPLVTDRLIVRLATMDDAQMIQDAKTSRPDDLLRRWMSWSSPEGMSMQGTIDYMQRAATDFRTVAVLAVDKNTGHHVLSTGLDTEDDAFHVISTGWWLSAGHEGKGLAFEAMAALITLLRHQTDCQTCLSDHYEGNIRSQNLMHRLGFRHIGTQPKAHICHLNGEAMDILNYRLDLQD
jgi:RimJ/RimL family protein N-acetyltransferase